MVDQSIAKIINVAEYQLQQFPYPGNITRN